MAPYGSAYYDDDPPPFNAQSGYILKLHPIDGTRLWATYFHAINDQLVTNAIDMAPNGSLLISGTIWGELPQLDVGPPSPNSTFYGHGPCVNGFVAMFNDDDQFHWGTHITADCPGAAEPVLNVCVRADANKIIVSGATWNDALPMPAPVFGATNLPHQGGIGDLFIYEFDLDGVVQWGTYFGGTGMDMCPSQPNGAFAIFSNNVAINPVYGDVVVIGHVANGLTVIPGPGWHQSSPSSTGQTLLARFDGSTRELSWLTYFYDVSGGWNMAHCVAYDAEGNLYIGGRATEDGTPLMPYLGYWYPGSPVPNTDNGAFYSTNDGFVVSFDENLELRYGSYFGGAGGPLDERINTIFENHHHGSGIHIAGVTSKDVLAGALSSYFPLDEGNGTPTFEENWAGSDTEGFVATICSEGATSVGPVIPESSSGLGVRYGNDGRIYIHGLPNGRQAYMVIDATGRCVGLGMLQCEEGIAVELPSTSLSRGMFTLQIGSEGRKFIVSR